MNVNYIGTDFQTNVDGYEVCLTDKLFGKIKKKHCKTVDIAHCLMYTIIINKN